MRKLTIVFSVLMTLSILLAACTPTTTETPTTAPVEITAPAGTTATDTPVPAPAEAVTLRVLIHQNPPMVDFVTAFNEKFQTAHPNITVAMDVVNANDLGTITQTRLTAKDVDVVDMFGFANGAQPYMKNVTSPGWQQMIEAGLLMDLTDQPFVKNYDEAALKDGGSFNGKIYEVNLGRVSYSGIFYNKDMFAANNVKVPTTWEELVTACATFKAANIPCMTAGGKDGWPIFVGAYGLLGAEYPDQAAFVKGLWDGSIKYNDTKSLEMWTRMQIYAHDMLEPGASGITGDAAPGRFASGAVAMYPIGVWAASAIDAAQPAFKWGYIPFPGSSNADDNKYLFGKYDQGWVIAADTPNKEAALLYLSDFSDPTNYNAFANAVGFIPTQPTAKLTTQIGQEVAPYLANYRVGYEQYWVAPKGAGQYASPFASFFKPFGTFDTAKQAGDAAQADLQAGLDANK